MTDTTAGAAGNPENGQKAGEITRRELYFFNLYRLLEALFYAAIMFSPFAGDWTQPVFPALGQVTSLAYLGLAVLWLASSDRLWRHQSLGIAAALVIDVVTASLIMFAVSGGGAAIPMMLIVNIGVGALLLPPRSAFALAALAVIGVMAPLIHAQVAGEAGPGEVEALVVSIAYLIIAALSNRLGRHMRAAEALAEQRGVDLLNLEQVNDLIIHRMKTGVLLVDNANRILRINESAWHLVGNPPPDHRELGTVAPELSRRLYHWRTHGRIDQSAVMLAEDVPEVIPRFTRLSPQDDSYALIFLDDTSLFSRRAEELTLASLGHLSASIAHEIRNPLAAIRYSAQLLAESPGLGVEDQRLAEIINNHCTRANDVIENVLQLSRRERSRPEGIDLNAWVLAFVQDYKQSNDLGDGQLRAITHSRPVEGMVDPQHLHQLAWNLVQNALRYGRQPGEPPRVSVVARLASDKGPPLVEVIDRGPGIPPKVAAQIFEPFYTSHEYGTGLGLYLARQMAEANQAALEYVRIAGGGSCFRVTLLPAVRHGTAY